MIQLLIALLMAMQVQTADRCQVPQQTLNPVRTTITGLAPIGSTLDGDAVSGYYYNANTGCYGYLLRINNSIANERYYEPGA
jgi:hypothetical protein